MVPDESARITRRSAAVDLLALGVVFAALVMPDHLGRVTAGTFVVAPIELVLGATLFLALPAGPRRAVGLGLGAVLGLLTVLKFIDLGFHEALGRPFDPVLDVGLLDDAVRLLAASQHRSVVVVAALGTVAAGASVVVGLTVAVRRLEAAVITRRVVVTPAVTVAAVGWLTLALTGVHLLPGRAVASRAESTMALEQAVGVGRGLTDRHRFEQEAAVDAFRAVPPDQRLAGLRGKDVVIVFVESYGRSALEDRILDSRVDQVLDTGSRELAAAGFGARSGFLSSSTAGGGSWLAQSTLLSGLWIDSQPRYRELVASDRLTLTAAFARAGWCTVAVTPGTTRPWPEAAFFGYQRVYDASRLDYRGPSFSWAAMPDQYTLAQFQRTERGPGHPPVMAVVPLVSSHAPWSPVPSLIDWSVVGDGSTYRSMAGPGSPPEVILTRDPADVRADYTRAIGYSLETLISYVRSYADDDLVMIFVGDHQPSPVVTGDNAGRDVPITIIARDPSVLARLADWRWTTGLRPASDAPVWRMDEFRDRFLSAFARPQGAGGHHR